MERERNTPRAENSPIAILIAEDQVITRLGLKMVLERFPAVTILGEVDNGQLAIEQAIKLRPDVVVMDIEMPVLDGIEATKKIKEQSSETKVLMLTSHDGDDEVFAALSAGADGYCLKDARSESLVAAIGAVAEGASWLDPAIAKRVLKASVDNQKNVTSASQAQGRFALSAREFEVLELLVQGCTNQQMAERLVITNETVKSHMRHIMEKLAVSDRTQAAVKALRDGLVTDQQMANG